MATPPRRARSLGRPACPAAPCRASRRYSGPRGPGVPPSVLPAPAARHGGGRPRCQPARPGSRPLTQAWKKREAGYTVICHGARVLRHAKYRILEYTDSLIPCPLEKLAPPGQAAEGGSDAGRSRRWRQWRWLQTALPDLAHRERCSHRTASFTLCLVGVETNEQLGLHVPLLDLT